MVDKIFYSQQPIIPVKPSQGQKPDAQSKVGATPFQKVLEQQLGRESIKFSAHAQQRLEARNIKLSSADMNKLNDAVQRAAQKGSKDSLVLMNDMAFVVSVANKTVITAVDDASMKEHVFTKIDSAVIV